MNARLGSILAIAAVLAAGAWAASGLRLGSDLARFMPVPAAADQRLLVGELGRGPGSRLLLLAIDGAEADGNAALSRALAVALAGDPRLARVLNGEDDLEQLWRDLLPLRFSHSPGMDQARFDAEGLAEAMTERLADLGAVGGDSFEALLGHDPHLLTVAMAQAWSPARQPALHDGVWVTGSGAALLLLETAAAGFDPGSQAQVLALVRERFAALPGADAADLTISGPGSFSARMAERVRAEATWLGAIASVGLVLLLLLAYRSPLFVLLSAIPLLCAGAAGLAALRLGFGEVHGITLAFAVTLIGVAQDYPVHLLSHSHPGSRPVAVARSLWPALRLGVASTVIAYLTLFSARAEGLAQLAVFTIAGLLTAALVTRFVLPALLPATARDVREGRLFAALAPRLARLRAGPAALLAVLALAVLAAVLGHGRPWWNNDLASLTPVPPAWLAEDARLRSELSTPDARHLLLLEAADREALLRASEQLVPRLDALVADGVLAGHGLPSRFLPSERTQAWRLARLPAPEPLRAALADAANATGFDPGWFEPMVTDVAAATAPGADRIRAQAFAASPAGSRLAAMLRDDDSGSRALVELDSIADLAALQMALTDIDGVRLVDLKATAEGMVAGFRGRVLAGLSVAAGGLLLLVTVLLGWRRGLRVLTPVLLGLLVTVAVLRLAGIELSLFHLIALMLAAGLGMDYALFFGHSGVGATAERTLHAVLLSALSTGLVFGLLATSSIPVLQAIGVTVAIGVASQCLLALLMARPPPSLAEAGHA